VPSGIPVLTGRANLQLATCNRQPETPFVQFQKVTLAGVGLLGGSLGLAVKQRGLANKVDGLVRRSASIAECDKLGVVDHATRNPLRAVENADLVVLCTPLARMRGVLQQMLPALKRDAIVTDVASAKASVVQELEPLVAGAGGHFVGSHPMAGAEKMDLARRVPTCSSTRCASSRRRRNRRPMPSHVSKNFGKRSAPIRSTSRRKRMTIW